MSNFEDGSQDVATCKDTTKTRIWNLEYVLRVVGILLTMDILEHSPLTVPLNGPSCGCFSRGLKSV